MTELPPINSDEPSSNDICAVASSPVLIFTPISSGVIADRTSQSSEASVNTPVAPINGFNKIGGITNAASSTTSPMSGSFASVVVVEVEVVESIGACSDSSDPPHAEIISERIIIVIFNFFIFLALFFMLHKDSLCCWNDCRKYLKLDQMSLINVS